MDSGIYCIRNKTNGKVYIGQSSRMHKRMLEHMRKLRLGEHQNSYLQAAFSKSGELNFEFIVLDVCAEEYIDERERHWIATFKACDRDNGYNFESGGNLNKKHSGETKRKMSLAATGRVIPRDIMEKVWASNRGRKQPVESVIARAKMMTGRRHTPESRIKMSLSKHGIPKSPEHKLKLSLVLKGRRLSPETCAKMSASRTGGKMNPESVAKTAAWLSKPIQQILLSNGSNVATYSSASQAAKILGLSRRCICRVANGTRTSYMGFGWKFIQKQ